MALDLNKSTPNGIPYMEVGGSPKFGFGQQQADGESTWIIAWSNLVPFVNEVFNYDYSGSIIPLPMVMPGYAGLYAADMKIEPADSESMGGGGSSSSASYYAKCVITWKTINEDAGGFTLTVTVGGEFVGVPSILAKWSGVTPVATSSDEGVTLGKLIPTIEYNLNWSRVTSVPWTTIRACIGCVNSTTMSTLNNAPAETVLFVGATVTGNKSFSSGITQWSVDFKFSEKPSNWNKFLRPSTGAFEYILFVPPSGGAGVKVYNQIDLNALLS